MRKKLFYLLCILAVSNLRESQASDPPGLSEVIERHKQSLESIATLHLKIQISYKPETDFGTETTESWLDGDNFRTIYRTTGDISLFYDTQIKGNTKKSYGYSNKGIKTGKGMNNGDIDINTGFVMGNPLPYCLFRLFSSGKTRDVPLWKLLEEPRHSTTLEKARIENNDFLIITLSHEKAKQKIWLSKNHNYLIKKIQQWYPTNSKTVSLEREVKEFKEILPGIYFPAIMVSKVYTPSTGIFQREGTIILKEIEINRPIPQTKLEFNFPPDILVFDAIKQKIWRTNSIGEIGVQDQTYDGKPSEYRAGSGLLNAQLPNTKLPTLTEPASLGQWVFLVALCLIMTGLILLAIKYLRKISPH